MSDQRDPYHFQHAGPMEVIMAVRFADGTISCFSGKADEVTFAPTMLFNDPIPKKGSRGLARSRIAWRPGVVRTIIPGVARWWSEDADEPTKEIEP